MSQSSVATGRWTGYVLTAENPGEHQDDHKDHNGNDNNQGYFHPARFARSRFAAGPRACGVVGIGVLGRVGHLFFPSVRGS